MINFEYAQPRTEAEAVEFLQSHCGQTAVLAGGTDLFNLLRSDLIAPKRVVDIKRIESLKGIQQVSDGLLIGAATTLDEILASPLLSPYHSLRQIADAHHSMQIQAMGTLGGDLCHLPNCWYFRNGYGLLGTMDGQSLAADGRNQFHAIFGNRGPAMFVSASRFAPALIAWGAKVRLVGPAPDQVELMPLEYFYVNPKTDKQSVTVLQPGQFVTHVWLPAVEPTSPVEQLSAAYEVLQLEGLDWPLASAAVTLGVSAGIVREAQVVLGHVAPTPWVSLDASTVLVGREVTAELAESAAEAAVAHATPLSENDYKVSIARAAVKRAILKAVDLLDI